MKKILSFLTIALVVSLGAMAQAPGIFNYQGVARNSVGNVLVNKTITLRLTIHDGSSGGPVVYQESRTTVTNPFGLFNVQVGSAGASSVTGTIAGVPWGVGAKYIQVEIDPAGGTSFINIGTAQIASVPYAWFATTASDLVLPFIKTQAAAGSTLIGLTNSATTGTQGAFTGTSASTDNNASAITGTISSVSPGGFSAGLRGVNNSTSGNGIGVYGSQNGTGWGVYGTTPGGRGVFGATTTGVGIYGQSTGSGTGGFFTSTSGLALHSSGNVRLQGINEALNRILSSDANGNATWKDPSAVGIVTGSGTLNFVPKWTPNGTNLGNSLIFDDGTNIGINTTTPLGKLNVNSGAAFVNTNLVGSSAAGTWLSIGNTDPGGRWFNIVNTATGNGEGPGKLIFFQGSAANLTTGNILTMSHVDRNVGINTTAPVAKLQVENNGTNGTFVVNQSNAANIINAATVDNANTSATAFGNASLLARRGVVSANTFLYTGVPTGIAGIASSGIGLQGTSETSFGVAALSFSSTALNAINVGTAGLAGDFIINNATNISNGIRVVNPNATAGQTNSNTGGGNAIFGRKGVGLGTSITNPAGLYGTSSAANGIGVTGVTLTNIATYGATIQTGVGVMGQTFGTGGTGVYALGTSSATSYALVTAGHVQIQGEGAGLNRILTSDAVGNATWQPLAGVGGVSGSGTLNYVPKWTPNGTTLGNSQIRDDGAIISTGNPIFNDPNSFNVYSTSVSAGDATFQIGSDNDYFGIYNENSTGKLHFTANTANIAAGIKIMTLDDNGVNGVGIGTVSPTAKLHAVSTPTTGGPDAVLGESANTDASAAAVRGVITSTTPGSFSAGIRGVNNGTGGNGIGVFGSQNGSGWGVHGTTPNGIGVYGYSNAGFGVLGSSNTGIGVWGISTTNTAGAFENTNAANTVSTVTALNTGTSTSSWGIRATSVTGTGYPGEATHAAMVAQATSGLGIVTSSTGNLALRAGALTTDAIYAETYSNTGNTAIRGAGLFANSYGVVGTAAAGTGAGGYFTGGTTALRTLGGVQLTGINEGANRILTTVSGTGQATWEDAATAGIVSGSGTLNFIPKWTPNGTTLGNSQVYDDGSQVQVGTIIAGNGSTLNIGGSAITPNASVSFFTGVDGFNIHENGTGQLNFEANNTGVGFGTTVMTLDDNTLNVGIGNTNPTAARLVVDNAATGQGGILVTQVNEVATPGIKSMSGGVITNDVSAIPLWNDNSIYAQRGDWTVGTLFSLGTPSAVQGIAPTGVGVEASSVSGVGVAGFSTSGTGIYGYSQSGTAINASAGGGATALFTAGGVRMTAIGEANGYVLTSDASGNATWQDLIPKKVGIGISDIAGVVNIPSGIATPITQWTNIEYENGGANYIPATGEYNITVAGVYEIFAVLQWSQFTATTNDIATFIYINGVRRATTWGPRVAAGDFPSDIAVHYTVKLNVNDKVQIRAVQSSGASQSLLPGSADSQRFTVTLSQQN